MGELAGSPEEPGQPRCAKKALRPDYSDGILIAEKVRYRSISHIPPILLTSYERRELLL